MGETTVSGDSYIETSFGYSYSHIWRNLGILIGFWIFFLALYLIATELNSSKSSTADVLLFLRGSNSNTSSIQSSSQASRGKEGTENILSKPRMGSFSRTDSLRSLPKNIFTWTDVVYTVRIKEESRRLLDNVSGWVEPGTLTALIEVSEAKKTTLLDALALRLPVGVVTGQILMNGMPLSSSFQSQTGMYR